MEQQTGQSEPIDWKEPRGYKQRFIFSLLPCGLIVFIYWFFGPLDLIQSQTAELHLDIFTALPYYAVPLVLFTGALAALTALLTTKRDAHYRLLCVVFALALASYIQGTFLNGDLPLLDGTKVSWEKMVGKININLAIWAGILIAVCILCNLLCSHRYRYMILCGMSAALILMQSSVLVSHGVQCAQQRREAVVKCTYSIEDADVVSTGDNVVVIVLDAFSNAVLKQTIEKYPDVLDNFNDFIRYEDCAPEYYATFPELNYILTGQPYDISKETQDNISSAWNSEYAQKFYSFLAEHNYERRLFVPFQQYITERYVDVEDSIDNAVPVEYVPAPRKMYRIMASLTCYRYFPLAAKAAYWMSPNDLSAVGTSMTMAEGEEQNKEIKPWKYDGIDFYKNISTNGIRLEEEKNFFTFYHFQGAHLPYTVSEAVTRDPDYGSGQLLAQCYGTFHIIDELLNQMRATGTYYNSTIIIMADHGDKTWVNLPKGSAGCMLLVKQKGETHEEMLSTDVTVSHANIIPTIVNAIDPSRTAEFGCALTQAKKEPEKQRSMRVIHNDPEGDGQIFYVIDYKGSVNELIALSPPDRIEHLVGELYPDN